MEPSGCITHKPTGSVWWVYFIMNKKQEYEKLDEWYHACVKDKSKVKIQQEWATSVDGNISSAEERRRKAMNRLQSHINFVLSKHPDSTVSLFDSGAMIYRDGSGAPTPINCGFFSAIISIVS